MVRACTSLHTVHVHATHTHTHTQTDLVLAYTTRAVLATRSKFSYKLTAIYCSRICFY